ncbi:hypothetical protein [Roseovarius sp. SYSU LYC5161]|nr:hypothetical protein [Roseovarius sp.]
MRTALILFQAGVLSCLAVYGAHSGTDSETACPLPTAKTDIHCND